MKISKLIGTITFAFSSIAFAFCQEEFTFKLYMESLANGKMDTLELGASPNGLTGCQYLPATCTPVFYPFNDTLNHIGAFAVTGEPWNFAQEDPNSPNSTLPLECPVFLKSKITPLAYDIPIVVPASATPVVVRWDSVLLSNPYVATPLMTDWQPQYRWDIGGGYIGGQYRLWMNECSSWIIQELDSSQAHWGHQALYVNIPDSANNPHRYLAFFICLGYDRTFSNESNEKTTQTINILPNPVSESFSWQSDTPIKEWEIHNTSGQLILNGTNQQNQIHCQRWPNGLYFFAWKDSHGNHGVQKIIKM